MAVGGRCSCGASIIFLRTAEGKRMPVELRSTRHTDDESTLFDPQRHQAHWPNCPKAEEYRKKKAR